MMGLIVIGAFNKIAEVRNFIQGDKEPYVSGFRSGYSYFGMVDNMGDNKAVLFLSDTGVHGRTPQEAIEIRKKFVENLKKAAPDLLISNG